MEDTFRSLWCGRRGAQFARNWLAGGACGLRKRHRNETHDEQDDGNQLHGLVRYVSTMLDRQQTSPHRERSIAELNRAATKTTS